MINDRVIVKYQDKIVGKLGYTSDRRVAFQYDEKWLENGFSLNPFELPLTSKILIAKKPYFQGLFGVFYDSLPDNWGRLLLDRYLESKGINFQDIGILDRLVMVGDSGMGALTYEPAYKVDIRVKGLSLDEISEECSKILKSEKTNKIETLFKLGGSSGGTRPKAMLDIDGEPWIVKFTNHIDNKDSGLMEYEYLECARECGINVPKTKLFKSNICKGYLGIKRFDRDGDTRFHMVTVAGLLEVDYQSPCLDYKELIKLTKILTRNIDEYEMFRLMCFNVFSHNQDDHAKNFTFIYYPDQKVWRLSPAYDLTYSTTYYGEHTTSVNGKGINISEEDMLKVGLENKLDRKKCLNIINQVKECVLRRLGKYIKK